MACEREGDGVIFVPRLPVGDNDCNCCCCYFCFCFCCRYCCGYCCCYCCCCDCRTQPYPAHLRVETIHAQRNNRARHPRRLSAAATTPMRMFTTTSYIDLYDSALALFSPISRSRRRACFTIACGSVSPEPGTLAQICRVRLDCSNGNAKAST